MESLNNQENPYNTFIQSFINSLGTTYELYDLQDIQQAISLAVEHSDLGGRQNDYTPKDLINPDIWKMIEPHYLKATGAVANSEVPTDKIIDFDNPRSKHYLLDINEQLGQYIRTMSDLQNPR